MGVIQAKQSGSGCIECSHVNTGHREGSQGRVGSETGERVSE